MKGWPNYIRTTGLVENCDEFTQNYPVGLGDGAARLGSIKTYDMRGRVWWMDDFEATVLHWKTRNSGVGGSQALTTDTARNGNQSVKLVSNVGAVRTSQISRYFPKPRLEQLGIEVSLNIPNDFGLITVSTIIDDGTNRTNAAIRIIEATGALECHTAGAVWIDSGLSLDLHNQDHLFHQLKYVLNYSTDTYTRLLYNHQETDLTGIATRTTLTAALPSMRIGINNSGDGINNVPVYVDDVILTIMEPN